MNEAIGAQPNTGEGAEGPISGRGRISSKDYFAASRLRHPRQVHWRLLHCLRRLQVATTSDLHVIARLTHTERATYANMVWLEARGLVRRFRVDPERGCVSPFAYALTGDGCRLLKMDRGLAPRRPGENLLRYLLYRNSVYAELYRSSWYVASPVSRPARDHDYLLGVYRAWSKWVRLRICLDLQRRGDTYALRSAQTDLDRFQLWLPKVLTFECAYRLDVRGRLAELTLLVIDDPRRSVECQVDELPTPPPSTGIAVFDRGSRINPATGRVFHESQRLRAWRRVLADRYGEAFREFTTLGHLSAPARSERGV